MIKNLLKTAQRREELRCRTCSQQAVVAVRQKRQELNQALQELAQVRKAKDQA